MELELLRTSRDSISAKTPPAAIWQQRQNDQANLTGGQSEEPPESAIHESIGMQPDAKHVYAEPGETRDNIAENRQRH